jgi:hypothetical protein
MAPKLHLLEKHGKFIMFKNSIDFNNYYYKRCPAVGCRNITHHHAIKRAISHLCSGIIVMQKNVVLLTSHILLKLVIKFRARFFMYFCDEMAYVIGKFIYSIPQKMYCITCMHSSIEDAWIYFAGNLVAEQCLFREGPFCFIRYSFNIFIWVRIRVTQFDYAMDWMVWVWFPAGAGNFSLCPCIQIGSGAHPTFCPFGTGCTVSMVE